MPHPIQNDAETRAKIREGKLTGNTAGLCPGYLQANVVVLPSRLAGDFIDYCSRNPKPCPLLAVGKPGSVDLPSLGSNLDLRTDLPGYAVYKNGGFEHYLTDISDIWEDDFVSFALGCSFTFENALLDAGVPMRHIEFEKTVPMFKTNIETVPSEMFAGELVVSMRPIPRRLMSVVGATCEKYPHAHGSPVHSGAPEDIGIVNLDRPDWGDSVSVKPDEVPTFWACGVTSQVAIQTSHVPLAITHKPGAMLITKVDSEERLPVFGLS